MSTKIVLSNGTESREVSAEKSAGKLLAAISSGRLTRNNAIAAKKLLAAEKVREVLQQFPAVEVTMKTEKEEKVSWYNFGYLEALAALAENSALWNGVKTEIIKTNRGRRKTKTAEEELEI